MPDTAPLIELKGITKGFGSFTANDHIDFDVRAGEIHALLGENGAGKSTLMNIIYGMYQPDAGEILVSGKPVRIASPKDALRNRIGMVHQHFMLVGVLSALEDIFLVGKDKPYALRNRKRTEAALRSLMERFHIDVDIVSPVEQLSIGMQQKVEILKLLYTGANVLIFDEPTAVLPPQECDGLFEIMESLKNEGKGIIFISHKLDEVLKISDRITVLTRGSVTGRIATADADKARVVRMMVGSEIDAPAMERRPVKMPLQERLAAREVTALDNRGVQTLNGVSLHVNEGEIVGIAGVDGNGQIELAEVLAGVRRAESGKVFLNGAELDTRSPKDFIHHRIAYVPADRNNVGSVPSFPLYENWVLRNDCPMKKTGLMDYAAIRRETAEAMAAYDVRARGIEERSANLSGGNLQKLIMARCLNTTPQALICAYPTRGLDIKASFFIREKILEQRNAGAAVLLLSGDFEELFALADRIVVLCRGVVAGEVLPEETSVRKLGMMMMGVREHA